MKKLALVLLLTTVGLSAFSQRTHRVLGWKISRDIPANEVKLNLGTSIFALYPEISYERILDSDMSVGVAAGIGLGDANDYPLNFSITPYFRWFFGGNSKSLDKFGAGFFIEANGGLFSTEVTSLEVSSGTNYYNATSSTGNELGAGLGLGLGWKYLSKNNWVGEIMLRGGREFVNEGAYPRMGISIGKRF